MDFLDTGTTSIFNTWSSDTSGAINNYSAQNYYHETLNNIRERERREQEEKEILDREKKVMADIGKSINPCGETLTVNAGSGLSASSDCITVGSGSTMSTDFKLYSDPSTNIVYYGVDPLIHGSEEDGFCLPEMQEPVSLKKINKNRRIKL